MRYLSPGTSASIRPRHPSILPDELSPVAHRPAGSKPDGLLRPLRFATILLLGVLKPAAIAGSEGILISSNGFSPSRLTVTQGDEVLWFNADTTSHITAAVDGTWSSRRISPDDYFAAILTAVGSHAYVCSIHPMETGIVEVLPAVPLVSVFHPPEGTVFGQPATFLLQAIASDRDGQVTVVEFFDSGMLLGIDEFDPFEIYVRSPSPEVHTLSAAATDDSGYTGTSSPVRITVTPASEHAARIVDIQGGQLNPSVLEVSVGDTVIFRNREAASHTATGVFTSREFLCGSTVLTEAQSCTNTFLAEGVFDYFCGFHPLTERGRIIVKPVLKAVQIANPQFRGDGKFSFVFSTEPGRSYVIESTEGLPPQWKGITNWVATGQFTEATFPTDAVSNATRFFRVVTQP